MTAYNEVSQYILNCVMVLVRSKKIKNIPIKSFLK